LNDEFGGMKTKIKPSGSIILPKGSIKGLTPPLILKKMSKSV